MTVVYSKAFETFTNLYFRQYKDGVSVLPEIKLSPSGSKPYSYEWITGLRNGDFASLSTWLAFGQTNAPAPNNGTYPNGQVDFWKAGSGIARTISFGTGCQGTLTKRPRVHARDSRPALGAGFKLTLDRFPATANFFLAIGTQILNPPLNLGFMGAPTCELNINFPLIVGLQMPSSGTMTVPWTVPNNNNLIGVSVFAQCLVIAPGSTPGNVVTTNALTVVMGN